MNDNVYIDLTKHCSNSLNSIFERCLLHSYFVKERLYLLRDLIIEGELKLTRTIAFIIVSVRTLSLNQNLLI